MKRAWLGWMLAASLGAMTPACGDDDGPTVDGEDAGGVDAGGGGADSGTLPGTDSGTLPETDSGTLPGMDSGSTPSEDAGTMDPVDAAMPTRPGAIGSACTMDTECTEPADATCQTTVGSGMFSYEFPGGYCTAECTAMSGSAECGAGAECVSVGFGGFGASFCAKTCSSDADCRIEDGYSCQAPPLMVGGGSSTYCLPPFDAGGLDGGLPFP